MKLCPNRTNATRRDRLLSLKPRLQDGLVGKLVDEPRYPIASSVDRLERIGLKNRSYIATGQLDLSLNIPKRLGMTQGSQVMTGHDPLMERLHVRMSKRVLKLERSCQNQVNARLALAERVGQNPKFIEQLHRQRLRLVDQ